jgi:hypothetical protein
MPALSQSLTFKINNSDTVSVSYPNTGTTALIYTSERIKGDGYFGGSDGVHTVFWSVAEFVGTIEIQGTLASEPGDSDWVTLHLSEPGGRKAPFTMDTTGLVSERIIDTRYTLSTTLSKSYNFTGNFVWLRGRISEFEQGVVNNISINR